MFQTPSKLKILSEVLSDYVALPEYYVGIHAFFDGETIFARDVVHVNFDLAPFPSESDNLWNWFREQLRGPSEQENFVYELGFDVEHEEDPVSDKLMEITRGSGMTIWTWDFEQQEAPTDGKRFVVVSIPDKKRVREFRETLHGRYVPVP